MRREIAVLLTADGTGRLFRAGCRAARVVGRLLAADIAVVVFIRICALADYFAAGVTIVIIVGIVMYRQVLYAVGQIRAVTDDTFVPVLFTVDTPCALIISVDMGLGNDLDIFIGAVVVGIICSRIATVVVCRRSTPFIAGVKSRAFFTAEVYPFASNVAEYFSVVAGLAKIP